VRDDVSSTLNHFYLKEAAHQMKFAKQEQADFYKTLIQMEKEDVPAQDIEDFKKAVILMKSVDLVRANAEKERQKRTSPSRYDKVKSKITAQVSGKLKISLS
jgi:hypothetical protein